MEIKSLSLIILDKNLIDELKELYKELNINLSENFKEDLEEIKGNIYVIINDNKIIGCATLIMEKKLYHQGKKVGHIEDLIINKNYQGLGLGKKLLEYLINICNNNNCYKIILDCNKNLISFYQKVGFNNKNIQMSLYL